MHNLKRLFKKVGSFYENSTFEFSNEPIVDATVQLTCSLELVNLLAEGCQRLGGMYLGACIGFEGFNRMKEFTEILHVEFEQEAIGVGW